MGIMSSWTLAVHRFPSSFYCLRRNLNTNKTDRPKRRVKGKKKMKEMDAREQHPAEIAFSCDDDSGTLQIRIRVRRHGV